MSGSFPTIVPTGRVWMPTPTTMVYTPRKLTIEDVRNTLITLHRHGVLSPDPAKPGQSRRLYPINYAPSDDPKLWYVTMHDDGGEVVDVTMTIAEPERPRPAAVPFASPIGSTIVGDPT